MGYVRERVRRDDMETAYRAYVTESLRIAPQGSYIKRSWTDIVNPRKPIDSDAIVDGLMRKLGGEE